MLFNVAIQGEEPEPPDVVRVAVREVKEHAFVLEVRRQTSFAVVLQQ